MSVGLRRRLRRAVLDTMNAEELGFILIMVLMGVLVRLFGSGWSGHSSATMMLSRSMYCVLRFEMSDYSDQGSLLGASEGLGWVC
jgi:hypothetical protein